MDHIEITLSIVSSFFSTSFFYGLNSCMSLYVLFFSVSKNPPPMRPRPSKCFIYYSTIKETP